VERSAVVADAPMYEPQPPGAVYQHYGKAQRSPSLRSERRQASISGQIASARARTKAKREREAG